MSMITNASAQMMRRSFARQRYRFGKPPEAEIRPPFGIFVYVPLCKSICSFCPFYKEVYTKERKDAYLDALTNEIARSPLVGKASWVYLGGGTPNVLTIPELSTIVEALKKKITSASWGIELLPSLVSESYLEGLAKTGFNKISIGIESFDKNVLDNSGRRTSGYDHIREIINHASSLGLWTNADIMIGLAGQSSASFLTDVSKVAALNPSQVTIYPFMVIRGLKAFPSMSDSRQFELIEQAGQELTAHGLMRKGVWTFARGEDVYDSSRDELVSDYVGFGPSAFSTYGGYKIVNPELGAYLKSLNHDRPMGFVAPKTQASDQWRHFARSVYDLRAPEGEFPAYIKSFIKLLALSGHIRDNRLTPKGVMFAHAITKAVVESLPFPVQNPDAVENYQDYLAYKSST